MQAVAPEVALAAVVVSAVSEVVAALVVAGALAAVVALGEDTDEAALVVVLAEVSVVVMMPLHLHPGLQILSPTMLPLEARKAPLSMSAM